MDMRIWAPPGEIPANASSALTEQDASWLRALMQAGGISHLMRRGGWRAISAPWHLLRALASAYRRNSDVDAYLVNWLQCALPLPRDGKPLVLTCLGNDLKLLDLPAMKWAIRRKLRGRACVITPNADWMEPRLLKAFGDLAQIKTVAFGIAPHWYAIERKPDPLLPRRWLAVTRLTRDKLGPLFEWSEPLFRNSGRELHLFGPMQEAIEVPDWVHYHGPATADSLSRQWFPQAQGLVTLSRHAEGRPQVMLEAMAAGLPIIASRSLAHASLVHHGTTGFLCDSPGDYAQALSALDESDYNRRMGEAARERIRSEVGTWDDCADRYAALYQQILGPRADG